MKKNPTIHSLRAGQTVWYVNALGSSSFCAMYSVSGKPYLTGRGTGLFVRYGKHRSQRISLVDCNVVPNKYNGHRLFYSRKKAAAYLKRCKVAPYTEPKLWSMYP